MTIRDLLHAATEFRELSRETTRTLQDATHWPAGLAQHETTDLYNAAIFLDRIRLLSPQMQGTGLALDLLTAEIERRRAAGRVECPVPESVNV